MGASIFLVVDPFGEVRPCNALELSIGNIKEHAFGNIWMGHKADESVTCCDKSCWMIGSASLAIKKHRLRVLLWIIRNKLLSEPMPLNRGVYAS